MLSRYTIFNKYFITSKLLFFLPFLFEDQLVKTCNCCDIGIPRILNCRYCARKNETECLNQVKYSSNNNNLDCQSSCPSNCKTVTYVISDEKSNHLDQSYYQQLRQIYFKNYYDSYLNGPIEEPFIYFFQDFYKFEFDGALRGDKDALHKISDCIVKLVINYKQLTTTYFEDTPSMTLTTLVCKLFVLIITLDKSILIYKSIYI